MDKLYDLIIIGSGPAGLTAGIYAQRAGLDTMIIEKNYMSGGQIVNTYEVDNYPGLPGISGFDMGVKFREHAQKLGAEFMQTEVKHIIIEGTEKKVETAQGIYRAKALIIAAGARHQKLNVPGEEQFTGIGVSYCATCDGAFFKDRTVAVVGGGDTAVEDAIFLARTCKKVYVIHRRNELRAARSLQDKLLSLENVEIVWSHQVEEIVGDEVVRQLVLRHAEEDSAKKIEVEGIFIAVGILPNSESFSNIVSLNKQNYIEAAEDCCTNIPGIFAAGDIRTKQLRQVITAAADGANAVTSVNNYLISQ